MIPEGTIVEVLSKYSGYGIRTIEPIDGIHKIAYRIQPDELETI